MVAKIEDIDSWKIFHDRQMKLEKMRLYFCVIGWQILVKVFPNHKVFRLYNDIISSPDYLREQLDCGEVDMLSLSMSSMGKIPQYNALGLNHTVMTGKEVVIKSEPFDEE